MTLRDVLEYRAADTDVIVFSLDDVPRNYVTLYARPFGAVQWGYFSGAMYWDAAFQESHTIHTNGSQA